MLPFRPRRSIPRPARASGASRSSSSLSRAPSSPFWPWPRSRSSRFQVKRQKERELRYDLWMMRDAIDKYKDAADRGAFQTKVDSQNYPPDLDTLVNGVDVQGKKLKFLRKIPVDPMTGNTDWGMRSMQDDPDSDSFGGQSVFDVHSKSQGTGLDGTKYSTW